MEDLSPSGKDNMCSRVAALAACADNSMPFRHNLGLRRGNIKTRGFTIALRFEQIAEEGWLGIIEFVVDAALMKDRDEVTIQSAKPVTVEWVYLGVKQ
jgi:hypothetical protein